MMSKIYILILALLQFSCSSEETTVDTTEPESTVEPTSGPQGDPTEWQLVWEDDFDTDLSKWNAWESGAFNNEIQFYRPEQLELNEGILSITVNRENATGDTNPIDSSQRTFGYVSGRIETKELFGPSSATGESEYRFMARIKMPAGNGMWPAFWSFGDPWPTQGEIDIIEARGNLPMEFSSNIFYGTEVNVPLTRLENTVVEHELEEDITADFHTYELIWTNNTLEIKFDDRRLHLYQASSTNFIGSLFNKKHKIVLNTAVGGDFFIGANPADFTENAIMEVDWVRVYKR